MQVLLQKTVKNLGFVGDVVQVAAGYYRNYLSPNQLAILADQGSVKQVEHQKKLIEQKKALAKAEALDTQKQMESIKLKMERSAGQGDKLFGAITSQEIVVELGQHKFDVDRRHLLLDAPIRTLGDHAVKIKLHPDVVATVTLEVVRLAEKTEVKKKEPRKKAAAPREKKVEPPAAKEDQ